MARPCSKAGCYKLQPCAMHPPRKPFANARRSSNLYDTTRWKQERKAHLAQEPNCRQCGARGTFVDHVIPHRGSEDAFWYGPRQTLCRRCSNAKTGRETRGRGSNILDSGRKIRAGVPIFDSVRVSRGRIP